MYVEKYAVINKETKEVLDAGYIPANIIEQDDDVVVAFLDSKCVENSYWECTVQWEEVC